MEYVTLLIAVVFSVLVLSLPVRMTLILYVSGLVWYPTYITMKFGTLDWSIPRFVILAVFLKIIMDKNLCSRFRWITLDYLIILTSVSAIIANMFTMPEGGFWEFHAGAQFDTLLVYFIVRLIVISKRNYLTLLKGLLVIAAPLAILGIYQCLSFVNPVGFFKYYHAWYVVDKFIQMRENFCRAELTFAHPIMFGLFFGIVGPWCAGLWYFLERRWRPVFICGILLMVLGLVSSMSSGPQLCAAGSFFAFAIFRYRRYWKAILGVFILMMTAIEFISNRHWYYVASSYLAFNADTAYYRCLLIEHALGGGMSGHWLAGFGITTDPGWWDVLQGSEKAGTDITNHYIMILVQFGLIGVAPFIAVIVAACKQLRKAFVAAVDVADKWMVWCMLASVTGILLAMFSVSLSCQPINLFYMMLGLCGVMPNIVSPPSLLVKRKP